MTRIETLGDDALVLHLSASQTDVEAKAAALRALGVFEDIVPNVGLLSVVFDPSKLSVTEAERLLRDTRPDPAASEAAEPLTIGITYDGEDLDAVAEAAGLSRDAVIAAHAEARFTVLFLGFTPGFAYLGGLPDALCGIQRLATPRVRVPAGSVGIAGGHCGIYALGGPGGWPIIGRADARLFDPSADSPFTLSPGRTVRFQRSR